MIILLAALMSLLHLAQQVVAISLNVRNISSIDIINSATFDTISRYEQFAAAAYCPSNLESMAKGHKLSCTSSSCTMVLTTRTNVLYPFNRLGTFEISGYVAVDFDNRLVILALRGTDTHNRANILDDLLSLIPQSVNNLCSGCAVARSFYLSWTEIRPHVFPYITKALRDNPGYRFLAVGHSLGGAIVNFAAFELRSQGVSTELATFGAPRFGNAALVNIIDSQGSRRGNTNYRVTHINDVVPRLPPSNIGYQQSQPNYFIQTGNNQVPTAANFVLSTAPGNPTPDLSQSIGAHSWYINNIAACGGQTETPGLRKLVNEYRNLVAKGIIPAE